MEDLELSPRNQAEKNANQLLNALLVSDKKIRAKDLLEFYDRSHMYKHRNRRMINEIKESRPRDKYTVWSDGTIEYDNQWRSGTSHSAIIGENIPIPGVPPLPLSSHRGPKGLTFYETKSYREALQIRALMKRIYNQSLKMKNES